MSAPKKLPSGMTGETMPDLTPETLVLPTVDVIGETIWRASRTISVTRADVVARAVRKLIASRVHHWVPVEPGTIIKAGTRYRIEWDDTPMSSAGGVSAVERRSSEHVTPDPIAPWRYFIDPRTVPAEPEDPRTVPAEPEDPRTVPAEPEDPRTVPAEPEDPRVAVLLEWAGEQFGTSDEPTSDEDLRVAHDLLARIDAARADA